MFAIGKDRVRRTLPAAVPYRLETDRPDATLRRYFDTPRPANDNRRTYRSVRSGAAYDNICSTRFRYVDVALAHVTLIDGAAA